MSSTMSNPTSTDNASTASQAAAGISLRKILMFDAITCVAMGLLLISTSGLLSELLGLPRDFVLLAGVALFPCAALMLLTSRIGTQAQPPAALVWLIIIGNAGWVIASLLTMELWFSPTTLGMVFILAQAAAVVVLAVLEYRSLRQALK
ncbi:hypothetical protein H8L32_16945 [Undibacterium sp. CY18W]|uniref:Uncharacterized protein n=1 Tax=Undibacterium hunanense TaxID=2762292 RepID=A0ABR6ZTE9_9BURK|nr:hypothetical protein [Undibacterium hunanense]MBC3919182.1 hypothetical protein [Undibacterium hunanense]